MAIKREPVAESAFGSPTSRGKKGPAAAGTTKKVYFKPASEGYPQTVELERMSMYRFESNQDCHFTLMSGQDESSAPEYVDATDMVLTADTPEYFSTSEENCYAGAVSVTTSGELRCTLIEPIHEWLDR